MFNQALGRSGINVITNSKGSIINQEEDAGKNIRYERLSTKADG